MRTTLPIALAALAACSTGPRDPALEVPAATEPMTFEVEPFGPDPDAVSAFAASLDLAPAVVEAANGHRVGQLRFELLPPDGTASAFGTDFIAVYYDYDANHAFAVTGDMEDDAPYKVAPSPETPPPSLDEFAQGVELALNDPEIAAAHASGAIEFFHAMPPTIDHADGHRVIAVGMRPTDDTETGEILGADLSAREILRLPGGGPPNAKVGGFVCNPPPFAPQNGPPKGVQGWARVRMVQQGQELWSMIVRRPSSSGGANGSGIELFDLRYRGKPMIARIHVPILNVLYDPSVCGPYRDWQWEENPFLVGTVQRNVANGIAVVDWAKTMRETRDDTGNFTGVALFWDAIHEQAVLISELEAGWYRYASEYRLGLDGNVTARFGFDAVQNWCTCQEHNHHAYWRVDWAIGSGANRVEQTDDAAAGAWTPISTEAKIIRDDAGGRRWRVSDPSTGDAVLVVPTPGEDPADLYGSGDMWVLANRTTEVDDSTAPGAPIATMANLDHFVNNEPVLDVDNVMWWAGHFVHNDADPNTNQTHTVQLNIIPETW